MIGKDFTSVIEKELFPVIPLVNYSKIPVVPWKDEEYLIKNKKELETLGAAYKREIKGKTKGGTLTGASLICGKASNIMVIDIDKNHGENEINGNDSFNDFIKDFSEEVKAQIFKTFTVETPRGGTHLYFKYKEGLKSKANYMPSVDVRTDGGLIVAPNSKVRVNEEVREYKVSNNTDINEIPLMLFNKLIELDRPIKKEQVEKKSNVSSTVITYKEGTRNQELFKEVIGIVSKSSIRDITTITSIARGLNLLKCNPPLENSEVNNIVGSITQRLHPSYCDDKGNVINWTLVEHIIKKQPSYTKGNLWFMYKTEKGFYEYMELKEVQRMYFNYAINDKDKTVQKSKNFADLLMLNSEDARNVHDEKKYINCLNGVIDIENDTLTEHSPNYKTEVQFQANYIEEWKEKFNNSEFKNFLTSTLDMGSIITLQESWGLILSPHAREVQNCFIYKGEGSNGKSCAFDIQEALIGDNRHICGIGLGDFDGEFVISMAEGKHVNIVRDDELSGKTVHKFFKSMVCGEPVSVNRKQKDLVRLGFNMCMFFGLNRMPSASDKSTGFFRRPIIIPFNISFGTEKEVERGIRDKVKDTGMADRIIKNELDIVFMWAYEGLKRIKANKWKVTVSEASEQEMEEYRQESDSAYSFFKAKIIQSPKGNIQILKDKVYKSYLDWCSSNDITPMNKIQFGRQFKSFTVKEKVSNSLRYWLNIEINPLKEVDDGINPFTKEVVKK